MHALLWARMLPDTIFIALGVVPLALAMARGMFSLRQVTVREEEGEEVTQPQPAGNWAQATD